MLLKKLEQLGLDLINIMHFRIDDKRYLCNLSSGPRRSSRKDVRVNEVQRGKKQGGGMPRGPVLSPVEAGRRGLPVFIQRIFVIQQIRNSPKHGGIDAMLPAYRQ